MDVVVCCLLFVTDDKLCFSIFLFFSTYLFFHRIRTEHEHATLVLKDLNNHEIAGESGLAVRTANPFNADIHALASTLLDYSKVVTTPMDFLIIQKKLDLDQYKSFEEFATDIRLVFSNCLAYNHQTSAFEIRAMANTLSHYFETVVSAITGRPRHVVAME